MAGLRDEIVKLIAENEVIVNTARFHNDMTTFETKDDVLTLLIHLGYLAINPGSKIRLTSSKQVVARIPNEEIKDEFRNISQ